MGYTINVFGSDQVALVAAIRGNCKFHLTGLTPGALQLDLCAAITFTAGVSGEVFATNQTGSPAQSNGPVIIQAKASI